MSSVVDDKGTETVSYIFETHYITKHPAISLAVVGSSEYIGNWDIQKTRLAKEYPKHSGKWLAAIECPPNTSFDWKWALVRKPNRDVVRWEERPNRSFTSGKCPGRVLAPWNGGMELLIRPKNKFKHKGIDITEDETDEEWSYLPSQELLNQLKSEDDDDVILQNEKEQKEQIKEKKTGDPNTTCVNRWTGQFWSGNQTTLPDKLGQGECSSRMNEKTENDDSNQSDKKEFLKPRFYESMIFRVRNALYRFCTIL